MVFLWIREGVKKKLEGEKKNKRETKRGRERAREHADKFSWANIQRSNE